MGYMMELRKKVGTIPIIMAGVTVVVKNEYGHVLLQRRTDTLDWGIIGGALELGESLEEAAHRELFEETGLKARAMSFVTVLSGNDMYYKYPHGDEVYNVTAVYEAVEVEGVPTIIHDDEGLELAFFDLSRPVNLLNPSTATILSKAGYLERKNL